MFPNRAAQMCVGHLHYAGSPKPFPQLLMNNDVIVGCAVKCQLSVIFMDVTSFLQEQVCFSSVCFFPLPYHLFIRRRTVSKQASILNRNH